MNLFDNSGLFSDISISIDDFKKEKSVNIKDIDQRNKIKACKQLFNQSSVVTNQLFTFNNTQSTISQMDIKSPQTNFKPINSVSTLSQPNLFNLQTQNSRSSNENISKEFSFQGSRDGNINTISDFQSDQIIKNGRNASFGQDIEQFDFLQAQNSEIFCFQDKEFQTNYTKRYIKTPQSREVNTKLSLNKTCSEESNQVSEFSLDSENEQNINPNIVLRNLALQKQKSFIDHENEYITSPCMMRRNSDVGNKMLDSFDEQQSPLNQVISPIIHIKHKNSYNDYQPFNFKRSKASQKFGLEIINDTEHDNNSQVSCDTPVKNSNEDFFAQNFTFLINNSNKKQQVAKFSPEKTFSEESSMKNSLNVDLEPKITKKLSFRQNLYSILEDSTPYMKSKAKQKFSRPKNIGDLTILQTLTGKNQYNGIQKKVLICVCKLNQQKYVLKQIPIKEEYSEEIIEDLRLLAEWGAGDSPEKCYFVKFYSSWIENDLLNIMIEQCQFSLEEKLMIQLNPLTPLFSEHSIRKLIIDIVSGLNYLHSQKCYHLALKPSNILYSHTEKFKLADLGLGWLNFQYIPDYWLMNKQYIAPEFDPQNNTNEDLSKCDIYSLGSILYELMSQTKLKVNKNIIKFMNNQYYSQSLKFLVASMIDPKPQQRPNAKKILNKMFENSTDKVQIEIRYAKEENNILEKKISNLHNKVYNKKFRNRSFTF